MFYELRGITYLVADWSSEDPKITKALEGYGRAGVPLYLLFEKGSSKPTVLPQILTEDIVLSALNKIDASQLQKSNP